MRCEAMYDGKSVGCLEDGRRVAIQGAIATVFGNLCEFHQREVMLDGKTVLECPGQIAESHGS